MNQREFAWLQTIAAAVREQRRAAADHHRHHVRRQHRHVRSACATCCADILMRMIEAALAELIAAYRDQQQASRQAVVGQRVHPRLPGRSAPRRMRPLLHARCSSAAGFGWMGWALREGKAISTRRDRYDANGLDGQGFHPFFTQGGHNCAADWNSSARSPPVAAVGRDLTCSPTSACSGGAREHDYAIRAAGRRVVAAPSRDPTSRTATAHRPSSTTANW